MSNMCICISINNTIACQEESYASAQRLHVKQDAESYDWWELRPPTWAYHILAHYRLQH